MLLFYNRTAQSDDADSPLPVVPGSVASCDVHRLSGEESVFDEGVDVLTELRQSAALA